MEQLVAAPADVDGDRQMLSTRGLDEHAAEPPRVVEVEAAETQLGLFRGHLLQRDVGWIVSHRSARLAEVLVGASPPRDQGRARTARSARGRHARRATTR